MEEENKIKITDNTQPEPESPEEPTTPTPEQPVEPTPAPTPEPAPAEPQPEEGSAPLEPSEPVITPEPETPTVPTETVAEVPVGQPKKSKKLPIILAIIAVLLVAGIIVAYFLIFNKPKNDTSNNSSPQSSETENKIDPTPEKEVEQEIALSDSEISPLFRKLLILHTPSLNSYLEYGSGDEDFSVNRSFGFAGAYNVSEHLYPDASELSESDKIYIATQYMKDQGAFKPIAGYGVPSDFYVTKYPNMCASVNTDALCSIEKHTAASEDELAKYYQEIFGETPTTFVEPTYICGRANYDPEYHIYYTEISGGCGGVTLLSHQLYINKITETKTSAYIYVSLASIYLWQISDSPYSKPVVYKTYLKQTDFYDYETNQSIIPDSSIYAVPEEVTISNTSNIITPENYTDFEQFRFVLEKSGENYYFKTVEKL